MVAALLLALGCPGPEQQPADTAVDDTGSPDTAADSAVDSGGDTDSAADTSTDTGPDPDTLDQDGDGYTPLAGDCDDTRAHVYPGAPDYCDGLDADCDGEPIPDGSCSEPGDASVMWTWSIDSSGGVEGFVKGPAGDVDGDGRQDLLYGTYGPGSTKGNGVLFGSEITSGPVTQPLSDAQFNDQWPRWAGLNPYHVGDTDGDGLTDLLMNSGDSEVYVGGVFLLYGEPERWAGDANTAEDGADAIWTGEGVITSFNLLNGADVDGDTLCEVLIETDRTDLGYGVAIAPGSTTRNSGWHSIADLPYFSAEAPNRFDYVTPDVLSDLDGDGAAEVHFPLYGTVDPYMAAAMVSGLDIVDGGTVSGSATLLTLDGGATPLTALAYNPANAGDIDGDGLADLAVEANSVEGGCIYFTSGGIPEGDVETLAHTQVCGRPEGPNYVDGWTEDIDGDDQADLLTGFGCALASSRLSAGGVLDRQDVEGPCFDIDGEYSTGIRTIANLDGDAYPETIVIQGWPDDDHTRYAIIAGFPIPYDDPAKW